MKNRRNFLKQLSAIGGGAALTTISARAMIDNSIGENDNLIQGETLKIVANEILDYFKPLEELVLYAENGKWIRVYDGNGVEYKKLAVNVNIKFSIAGALGIHTAILFDNKNKIIDFAAFKVNTKTQIEEYEVKCQKVRTGNGICAIRLTKRGGIIQNGST